MESARAIVIVIVKQSFLLRLLNNTCKVRWRITLNGDDSSDDDDNDNEDYNDKIIKTLIK